MPTLRPISILFVCTGNICRSPTAHAVFEHMVREAGLSHLITVDSAGTHGYHIGQQPDARSIAVALSRGVDMRGQRARKFDLADFGKYDYIFAMDQGHHTILEAQRKGGGELSLFLGNGGDVPDPYYGEAEGFERVYALAEHRCAELLAELRDRHGF